MAYAMNFFSANTYESVMNGIAAGKVQYPSYVFIRSEDGSETGRLAFVDQGNVLKFIRGEGEAKQYVVRADELPETGDTEVIYIVGKQVYTFDGTDFNPIGTDHTAELEALTKQVTDLEEKVAALNESLAAIDGLYEEREYEVSHKPVGTLVDYRDKEIRVMCPVDTEFVLQNSGAGSDANKYYIGFKAYAPDDAVSFKEDLAQTISDETMYYFEDNDFAGTDAQGRKYSIVWLPVAVYADGAWTYYGANSTAEKYIGWYYSVEWYNADGVLIASDRIRINLANEDCYSIIEPYYVGKIEEMATKITELETKDTELEAKVTTLEETVAEIDGVSFTELE